MVHSGTNPPPNPTRRAPTLALPPHLRDPGLRVEEGEVITHLGLGPETVPALPHPPQGLGDNSWAHTLHPPASPSVPACAHRHTMAPQ